MVDYVEIKAIVTKESYDDFFKQMHRKSDTTEIFDFFSKYFDIKQVECHGAHFQEHPKQKVITVSGNGSIVSEKGWESSVIID